MRSLKNTVAICTALAATGIVVQKAHAVPLMVIAPIVLQSAESAFRGFEAYVSFSERMASYAEAVGIPLPTTVETKILRDLDEISAKLDVIDRNIKDIQGAVSKLEKLIVESPQKNLFVQSQALSRRVRRDVQFVRDNRATLSDVEISSLFEAHVADLDRLVSETSVHVQDMEEGGSIYTPTTLLSLSTSVIALRSVTASDGLPVIEARYVSNWRAELTAASDKMLENGSPVVKARNTLRNQYTEEINRIGLSYGIENFFQAAQKGEAEVCLESRFAHPTPKKVSKPGFTCYAAALTSTRNDRETGEKLSGRRPSYCVQFQQVRVKFDISVKPLRSTKVVTSISDNPTSYKVSTSAEPDSSCKNQFEDREPEVAYGMFAGDFAEDLREAGYTLPEAEVQAALLEITRNVRTALKRL